MSDTRAVQASRSLGKTGLLVSPLCLGTGAFGTRPEPFAQQVPEADALATLRATLASPINYIDTAALYGDGLSEYRVGLVIRELGGLPSGAVLQTKAGRDPMTGAFSADTVKRQLARSLKLLGLDHLQMVYLHDPEHTTFEAAMAPGGPFEALRQYRDQGVIGHLGVAGGPPDLLTRFVETGAFEALVTHNRFTLVNRTADALLSVAAERGMAVLNAAPYGGGMLAEGTAAYPYYMYQDAPAAVLAEAQAIETLCDRYGVSLAAAALQFSLRDRRITSTIVGLTRPEHVPQTLRLADAAIPDDFWVDLARRLHL